MTHSAIVRFADGGKLRLRLTARGAFSSTLARARWAATDALRAEPGEHTGPVACVEIVRGGRVVERAEWLAGHGRIQMVEVVRSEGGALDSGPDPWDLRGPS